MSKGFFQDSNGDKSMMRLLVFLGFLASFVWGSAEVAFNLFGSSIEIHESLILAPMAFAFGSKIGQKYAEKGNKTET